MWLHSLKVAQLLRSAACLHTNQSRSYLNHLVISYVLHTFSVYSHLFNLLANTRIWRILDIWCTKVYNVQFYSTRHYYLSRWSKLGQIKLRSVF